MKKYKIVAIVTAFTLMVCTFAACTKNKNTEPSVDTSSNSVAESVAENVTEDTGTEEDSSSTAEADKTDASSTTSTTNPSSISTTKSVNKPVSSTKPETTTKKQSTTTTTKPAGGGSTSSQNTYATFKASTGETIRYTKYRADDGVTVTKVEEKNGVIYFYRDDGTVGQQPKCDNCGKYLCTGCEPFDVNVCPWCGRDDCWHPVSDVNCPACGKPIKANTCHYCNGK